MTITDEIEVEVEAKKYSCPASGAIVEGDLIELDGRTLADCHICGEIISTLTDTDGDYFYKIHISQNYPHPNDEWDYLEFDFEETVNMVVHYHGDSTMKYIEEFNLNFALGNVIKYVSRADSKGDPIEALEKAMWYLDREIQKRRRETPNKPVNETKA